MGDHLQELLRRPRWARFVTLGMAGCGVALWFMVWATGWDRLMGIAFCWTVLPLGSLLEQSPLRVEVTRERLRARWTWSGFRVTIRREAIRSAEVKRFKDWRRSRPLLVRDGFWDGQGWFSFPGVEEGLLVTYEGWGEETRTRFISMRDPHAALRILTGAPDG